MQEVKFSFQLRMRALLRDKNGVMRLPLLLTIIVSLFVIGFLVMIFAIMGGEIQDTTQDAVSGTVTNESTVTVVNETGIQLEIGKNYTNPTCTVSYVLNDTHNETYTGVASGNYTISGACRIAKTGDDDGMNNSIWNITYTYNAFENTTASNVAFDTKDEIGDVTDWYAIIIVIAVMVVLIALTVVIIVAIRGSGMLSLGGGKAPTTTA